jgi:pyruvate/2-oxoglutarate dehydrogenase complex dihydrolipoamide acyltransferase (E2) component
VRFNDNSGREELIAILKPYLLKAPADGTVQSSMREGSEVGRRTPLARIEQSDGKVVEIRSPLQGRVNRIFKPNGSQVTRDEDFISLNSDEESVFEALRGLGIIGTKDDLAIIDSYAQSTDAAARVKEQAALTANAINHR